MFDKTIIAIISIFVLVFVAGIVYLFVSTADKPTNDVQDLNLQMDSEVKDSPDVSSEISDSPDPRPTYQDPVASKTRIETIKPEGAHGRLDGRVLDSYDKPINQAQVALYRSVPEFPMKKLVPTHVQVKSDASGKYSIVSIPAGTDYEVFVSAPGYASAKMEGLTVASNQTTQVAEIRLGKGFVITGTISDPSGNPIQECKVQAVDKMKQLAQMSEEDYQKTISSDDNGSYILSCLSKSQYEITFSAPSYRSLVVTENFILAMEGEAPRRVDATLDPSGLTIQGVVLGPSGRAVPKAEITALFTDSKKNAHFSAETTTDDKDQFILPGLSEGDYTLNATARGFFQKDYERASAGTADVEITMSPTGSVTGTINTAGRAPRAYMVHIDSFTPKVRVTGRNRTKSINGGPKNTFRIPDLLPGIYTFLVKADGFAQTVSEEVTVMPGETYNDLVIHLLKGGDIEGRIMDVKNDPISGVKILLKDRLYDPSLPFEEIFVVGPEQEKKTLTDAEGRFKLRHVREGEYCLRIEAEGRANRILKEIQVAEGESLDLGRITLSRGGNLKGIAYDEIGEPARGNKVSAVSTTAGNRKSVTTDDKGCFEFMNLAPGEYMVSMTPKDFWAALKYKSTVTVFVSDNQTTRVEIYTEQAERKKK